MTVMPGTQKVTFGRNGKDTDYESKLAAAKAQSQNNAYVQGVQDVMNNFGQAVKEDRTPYGNSNIPVNELIQGSDSFRYKDSPGNQPLNDRANQTGSLDTQAASTYSPQQDPKEMETDALSRRLAMMAEGGQGFPGLNNRNREV